MKRMWRWGSAVAAGLPLIVLAAGSAHATPAYAKAEQTPCSYCHDGKTSDKVFTDAGTPPGNAAPAPAGTAAMAPDAGPASPCGCECVEHCAEKPCGHHGPMHGGGMLPPMREKVTGHLEEMRQAVSVLRENERKLEAAAGSDPFRAAVMDHLRKLDDLQASHLEHMESMMGQMGHGKAEMRCGKYCPPGCKEKHGGGGPCGGMKR